MRTWENVTLGEVLKVMAGNGIVLRQSLRCLHPYEVITKYGTASFSGVDGMRNALMFLGTTVAVELNAAKVGGDGKD